MLTDVEIAQNRKLLPIEEIASKLGIKEDSLTYYGRYKAKVSLDRISSFSRKGKLIYVTAITPTKAGEGKTTIAIGLTQALGRLGKQVALTLREPSLGPTFGIKGGATGGGYAQVLPMADINLHFTGDIHSVGTAHNLLAALVDNHIYFGNHLNIDPKKVNLPRVIDLCDRQLRFIVIGLRGEGVVRESRFDITAASEVMAILCLSKDIHHLKEKLGNILVAYTYKGEPVFAKQIGGIGSLTLLLQEAIKPNLVQTLEGQPVFIHGGPFANIAHGNNSVVSTMMALKLADFVVTEGGFGSELGAEKFFDIVTYYYPELTPDVVVLVASIRALYIHGEGKQEKRDLSTLKKGLSNLKAHIKNIRDNFNLPLVVALNHFPQDREEELKVVKDFVREEGVDVATVEVVTRGGEGGEELATLVLSLLDKPSNFKRLYSDANSLEEKVNKLATLVYGAKGVKWEKEAFKKIKELEAFSLHKLPVCVAKTQLSLSDDPKKKGAPKDWELLVRDISVSSGAGFIVVYCGPIMTMPGLPAKPNAFLMDVDENGKIKWLS